MGNIVDRIRTNSLLILLWLALVALSGVFAYVFYETVLIWGIWLSESETFRPRSWNFTRLKWLGKFTGVVMIGAWIFFMAYLESVIGDWHKRGITLTKSKQFALTLIAATVISLIIAQSLVLLT